VVRRKGGLSEEKKKNHGWCREVSQSTQGTNKRRGNRGFMETERASWERELHWRGHNDHEIGKTGFVEGGGGEYASIGFMKNR